ncbi:hypothetical protein [Escherichia coli IS1]|nr:hypothetical protein [Escherichia coli IS1]
MAQSKLVDNSNVKDMNKIIRDYETVIANLKPENEILFAACINKTNVISRQNLRIRFLSEMRK